MLLFKILFGLLRLPFAFLPGTIGQPKATKLYQGGKRLQEKGMLEEAIAEYDKVLERDPYFVQAYSNRGATYHKLGKPELTIIDLNEAIRLQPKLAVGYNERGMAYGLLRG